VACPGIVRSPTPVYNCIFVNYDSINDGDPLPQALLNRLSGQ